MPDAVIGLLATALPALVTIWSSGRRFRERRVLKEEMDLHNAWSSQPGAVGLRQHIDQKLLSYVERARLRQHSVAELARRLLSLVIATWLAALGVATAAGALKPGDLLSDPDSWLIAVTLVALASGIWTVATWIRSRRSWSQAETMRPLDRLDDEAT